MDPVRLGRVLGIGARAAAKTVVHAVDAATATNPSPQGQAPSRQPPHSTTAATPQTNGRSLPRATAVGAGAKTRLVANQLKPAAGGIREGSRRFGREIWNPFVRLSGVLWLEVTGVFFGIFALFAMGAAWRLRTAWHTTPANAAEHQRLVGALAMLGVFGYFCVSSFVRAKRRERRR